MPAVRITSVRLITRCDTNLSKQKASSQPDRKDLTILFGATELTIEVYERSTLAGVPAAN